MVKDGNKSSTSLHNADKKSPKDDSDNPAKLRNSLARKFKRAMPNNEDKEFWEQVHFIDKLRKQKELDSKRSKEMRDEERRNA